MASGGEQDNAAAKEESDWDREIEDDSEETKRKRTMTERGLAFKIDSYAKTFKSLKHRSGYIKNMISDKVPPDVIRVKHREWLKEFEQFMTIHSDICPNLSEDEREPFETQHEQNEVFLENMKGEMEHFFLEASREKENEMSVRMKRNKNRSLLSHRTTSTETVVTKRLKEEQRIATLSAMKQTMRRRKELEMAKLTLKFEEEELEVDTNLAISTAKSEILKKYEMAEEFSDRGSILGDLHRQSVTLNPYAASFVPPTMLSNDQHIDPVQTDNNNNVPKNDSPQPTSPRPTSPQPTSPARIVNHSLQIGSPSISHSANNYNLPQPVRFVSDMRVLDASNNGNDITVQNTANIDDVNDMTRNESVVQSVVKYLRKPTPEIKTFNGNPMEYRRFLRQFNAKVVQNTETDAERMNYLEQLTSGEANKVVSGFGHLTDEFAYKSAMNALEERYGDNDVIVAAFIKRALDWPQVKDAKMLDEFSLFLVECENAAASINSNSVLDFSENIKRLLSKLPVYMHDR